MLEEHGKRTACSPTLFEAASVSATRDKISVILRSTRKHIERVQKILCFSLNMERIPAQLSCVSPLRMDRVELGRN